MKKKIRNRYIYVYKGGPTTFHSYKRKPLSSTNIYCSKKNYIETKCETLSSIFSIVRKDRVWTAFLEQNVGLNKRIKVTKRAQSLNSRSKQVTLKLILGNYNKEAPVPVLLCILKCQASEIFSYSTETF
jgi:hypothetical protein